jgi:hypothetical protein
MRRRWVVPAAILAAWLLGLLLLPGTVLAQATQSKPPMGSGASSSSAPVAPPHSEPTRPEQPVDPEGAPPTYKAEVEPPPRANFVWAPGFWSWDGHQYVWAGGHWEHDHPGHHWIAARWVERGGRYVIKEGHWD